MKNLILYSIVLLAVVSNFAYANDGASLWVFSGKVANNEGSTPKVVALGAFQIEQEMSAGNNRVLVGYLNESSIDGDKTDGLYGMYKVPFQFTNRIETSVAGGAFAHATTVEHKNDSTAYGYKYGVSALAALSIRVAVTDNVGVQARFEHDFISTNGGPSKDMFFFGVGYAPKGW